MAVKLMPVEKGVESMFSVDSRLRYAVPPAGCDCRDTWLTPESFASQRMDSSCSCTSKTFHCLKCSAVTLAWQCLSG